MEIVKQKGGFVNRGRLADRLGLTVHQSLLDRHLQRLMRVYPSCESEDPEGWLLDVAHARGAHIVHRTKADTPGLFTAPSPDVFSNEELVVAICALQRADQPQLLRLAAQLVSRGAVDVQRLLLLARRERADLILGELARQALKVEPDHTVWRLIADEFPPHRPFRSPVMHWQRLAWPVMAHHRANAQKWELVR